jgi:polysaccharide pyruvyl transferase WcaK-like protein
VNTASAPDSPRLAEFLGSADPDVTFMEQLRQIVAKRRDRGPQPSARRPDRLRLLLVGYTGAGNTGADVRVSEIIRQLQAILGPQRSLIGLTILGDSVPSDVFSGAEQVPMGGYAVDFLDAVADHYDGMLACEGSMFKSKNSNIFSGLMGATLGVADTQGKLAVAYAADVGPMDPLLRDFIAGLGSGPYILCRSPESTELVRQLGLRADLGADPAWTYEPAPPQTSREGLRSLGGTSGGPLLVVCPVNPFWWPVKIDVAKAMEMERTGAHRDTHYGSVFFHQDSEDRRRRYHTYLDALAAAARVWRDETRGSVVIVGMERIDTRACADLAARLPFATAQILSGQLPVGQIVGVLRLADLLISSRYHAIVTSMPAQVPAIGVSMDERIANLLRGFGAGERLLQVDDPQLGERLIATMRAVRASREAVEDATGREVARQIRAMARMGAAFASETHRIYPEVSVPPPQASWEHFLPSLSPRLETLLQRYT